MSGIVALLTDFGTRDAYVGVMKGVLLSRFPALSVVDLSHELPPHGVLPAAYLLYSAWDYFPPGSAFCAVVDPGVGGPRGTLLAEEGGRFLVAPDNGLVSLLARMKPSLSMFALNAAAVLQRFPPPAGRPLSTTFHGRDLFAPGAALCAAGQAPEIRGPKLAPVLLAEVAPREETRQGGPALEGRILHIDRFGNCITSIHRSDLERALAGAAAPAAGGEPGHTGPAGLDWDAAAGEEPGSEAFDPDAVSVNAGSLSVRGLKDSYGEAGPAEALAVIGSAEFLELSVREDSAARRFGLCVGEAVWVQAEPRQTNK